MDELIVKEREVKENLVRTINEAGLPAFILYTIIKDLEQQLNILQNQQYAEAKSRIEDKVKQNKKAEEDNNGKNKV